MAMIINTLNGSEGLRKLVLIHMLFIAASIGLTHVFRLEIRERRIYQPVNRMWMFLVSGVILISLIQTGLVVWTNQLIPPPEPMPLIAQAAIEWGMLLGTGVWTVLYIRFTEKRHEEEREGKLRAALSDAELRALEMQINPHFLFNCLNSIRALVAENPARAQDMITRLANIFRHNLHRPLGHTVSLSSEVEAVRDYLELESMRFEDRLRVEYSIAPGAEQSCVPSMLLQTLVENALKHGIAPRPAGGDLLIRAERTSGATKIEVENTGHLGLAEASSSGGVGLNNTRERLKLLYGDRASLQLRDSADGRVIATALIPA